jgi:hypothetical protein
MARSIQTEDFIMRAMSRRATRDHLNRPGERLSDGVGGTITGGPMQPVDVWEILNLGARGCSRGGAVSGAAQTAVNNLGVGQARQRAIALSDGSRITFSSLDDNSRVLVEA